MTMRQEWSARLTTDSHINVMPLSRERRIRNSFRNEFDVGTTSVPLVGCS